MKNEKVLIVGGGTAGLTAALELANSDIRIDVVDRSDFLGGHAVRLSCKAVSGCVKCGACIVEEKLDQARRHPRIRLMPGTQIRSISRNRRFNAELRHKPVFIDPVKCNACGVCMDTCPVEGGVFRGSSKHHVPFYAISEKACIYLKDRSCRKCEKACPQKAICLDLAETMEPVEADAVILAYGFSPFCPENKPYGYGIFKNVITSLELETMVRGKGRVTLPLDGREPGSIAFIQCVGSRDAKLHHLWCSKYCCGFALRMADLIKARQPLSEITLFYIDIQTFGNDFGSFYDRIREKIRMIRIIPGDIYPSQGDQLKVTYFDNAIAETVQEEFDLVVLS
ncbi:MAG: hypothetical protein A2V65_05105, partial [Deltaproteobacteria bacterium RBG_13_49_15]